MSAYIHDDGEGRLVLDLREEPGIASNPDFRDVLLAFSMTDRQPDRIVLEVGGRLAEALDYIQGHIHKLGYEVHLSSPLQRIADNYRRERQLIHTLMDQKASEKLLREIPETPAIPGFLSSARLLPHQVRGLRRALAIENLAEFSVQGSGKTALALGAFAIWKSRGAVEKILVIGPTSCMRPWELEVQRCLGTTAQSIRWSGAAQERRRLVPAFRQCDLVLCTYDTAIRDVEMLAKLLRDYPTLVILDESHYIKNFRVGSRASTVFKLAPYAAKRMILTGTPAPHSLYDLWTQFTFLWPAGGGELVGTRQQFQDTIDYPRSPTTILRQRLSPFFHRTTQSELGLPEPAIDFPTIAPSLIPLEQARIINLLEVRILAEGRRRLADTRDRELLREWQKARVIRLLQAASNPGLLLSRGTWSPSVGDVDIGELMEEALRFQHGELLSGKIRWTVAKVRDLVGHGKKVVVWTWWVENVRLLSRLLADLNPLLLYGGIKPYEEDSDDPEDPSRERNIEEFKTRVDRPILIANPAACAEAISLHRECHDAIYVDRTFNCGQFLQSLNRIHRVGLPDGATTHYWIPLQDCAVERSVNSRLQTRQQVMYDFLDDDAPVIGKEFDETEESDLVDTRNELDEAFRTVTREIERGNQLYLATEGPSAS